MQAGLICEYVAKRWGQSGLERMLGLFADGKDTAQAIQSALEIAPEQFDEDFAVYVEGELGAAVAQLEPWQERQTEAHEALRAEDWRLAVAKAAEAIELFPDYVDEGSPYLVRAQAHRELGESALATDTLQAYRRLGGHDPDALISLGRELAAAGRNDDSIDVFEDVLMVAPLRQEVHAELGDRLLAAGRPKRAAVEYEALLAMNPHDLADAHYRVAKAYFAAEDQAKTREHLLYALEIAPHYREAQQLLLEIVR
jgi:tetratricopeptide (TPR) repeat protein